MLAARTTGVVSGLFFAASALTSSAPAQPHTTQAGAIAKAIAHLPVTFEENKGQSSADVRYVARTTSFTTLIRSSGAAFVLRPSRPALSQRLAQPELSHVIAMHLIGADPRAAVSGQQLEPEKSNYFTGNDPTKWHTEVPHYARVKIHGVYPHVDMLYYATEQQLEYDFVISPLGNPERLRMRFDGQDRLSIDRAGELILKAGTERLTMQAPTTYQMVHGQRKLIPAAFVQSGQRDVKMSIGTYDHTLPLIIDPKLKYSSYLGGTDDEGIFGIGFDLEGNIYVAGETSSLDFPGAGVPQEKLGGNYDAFVSKFSRDGSRLLYSTYLGGLMYDHAVGLAVEPRGAVYIAGITSSRNFPVVDPLQPSLKGSSNAFITKLSSSGSQLVFSTYLGGSGEDGASGITIGRSGDVFVAGYTTSPDFPTAPGGAQEVCDLGVHPGVCTGDGFLTKLNASGTQLRYSTFLGGSSYDQISAVKVDQDGTAYVVGQTSSTDFPTRDAFQPALAGYANAFVAKVSPTGNSIEASSYLGGEGFDAAMDLALDDNQNIYVTGFTSSATFPTLRPIQGALAGQLDAFVVKVLGKNFELSYATYLGGAMEDIPFRIVVDALGDASIAGYTSSTDFPLSQAIQAKFQGGTTDAFVSRLDANGSKLAYSSYLGGRGDEFGYALQTDLTGSLWVGGSTSSKNLPLVQPFQAQYGGGPFDAFLSKTALEPINSVEVLTAAIRHLQVDKTLDSRTAERLIEALDQAHSALQSNHGPNAVDDLYVYEERLFRDVTSGSLSYEEAIALGRAGYDIIQELQ